MNVYKFFTNSNILTMPINLGLCCINTELRSLKPPIFCSRSCIRRTFSIEKAKKLALQNVKDIIPMIQWNHKNHIKCFRLSSDMYPHFTDTETEKYTIDFTADLLQEAGTLANSLQQRILMHPGQYNQIASPRPEVIQKTHEDLEHHSKILDLMNIDTSNGSIIIHGGGLYGNKENTMRRWLENYDDLPSTVKRRLVLENCERNYNINDCLFIHEQTKIPIVFDFHHHQCHQIITKKTGIQQELPELEDILPRVAETWKDRVLMHISEQGEGKIGHHSDFIETLPVELITFSNDNPDLVIDLEVEAKMKEQAIKRLFEKYPFLINK